MHDFYACVECGRCTDVCPASGTGKMLSPMDIMIKLRDHLTEKGAAVTGTSPWVPEMAFANKGPNKNEIMEKEEEISARNSIRRMDNLISKESKAGGINGHDCDDDC